MGVVWGSQHPLPALFLSFITSVSVPLCSFFLFLSLPASLSSSLSPPLIGFYLDNKPGWVPLTAEPMGTLVPFPQAQSLQVCALGSGLTLLVPLVSRSLLLEPSRPYFRCFLGPVLHDLLQCFLCLLQQAAQSHAGQPDLQGCCWAGSRQRQ